MSVVDPGDAVRRFYDELGEGEWERLVASPRTRVSFEVHRRFLAGFVRPGWRVLEVGAGPGRFTIELARLGATVVVTDLSPVQLKLNEEHVGASSFEAAVERRELLDVRDASRYADGEFDAVLAYGGPLSYAFEQVDEAVQGLFRVARSGGPVIASVMSLLGTWRYFLAGVVSQAEIVGEDANDAVLRTGDLRTVAVDPGAHICQMFRWRDLENLVARNGGVITDASASNFASLGDEEALERIERDPDRWRRFVEHEVRACRELGARDAGTHILFAAQRT